MEVNPEKREKLKNFYFSIKDCRKCSLGNTRMNFVFGGGNSNAAIVFIGEAPGKNEDLQGKPFVGQAGKILDSLLESIGFVRSDVFIANVLKCRPPRNRDPEISEINLCKGYLFKQLEIIDPAIICTMGRYSTRLVLETDQGINTLRGKVFRIGSRIIIPINHPAAALYTPSRLQLLKDDFIRIKTVFDKISQRGLQASGKEISIDIIPAENISGQALKSVDLQTAQDSGKISAGNEKKEQENGRPAGAEADKKDPADLKNVQEGSRQLGLF